jgi:hypothetical protein
MVFTLLHANKSVCRRMKPYLPARSPNDGYFTSESIHDFLL